MERHGYNIHLLPFMIAMFGILVTTPLGVNGRFTQKLIYLQDYRNQTAYIECKDFRTGTIALRRLGSKCPTTNFFVNLRVRYGEGCGGHLRFFLNVRQLQLENWEKLGLYESHVNQESGQMLVGKGQPYALNQSVPSVAQFFTVRDIIRFEYTHSEACQESLSNVELDFTLIQSDNGVQFGELWCPALNGYLPREVFCFSSRIFRISCPQQFQWSDYGNNPGTIFRHLVECSAVEDFTPEELLNIFNKRRIVLSVDFQNDHDQDIDDTPDLPDTPDQPDTEDLPDTPDKPDKPDTPDLPDSDTRDPPEHEHEVNEDDVHWENAMYPFPFPWTPRPFNEEDQDDPRYYDPRYRHHRTPSHVHRRYYLSTWSIILGVAGAIALVVVIPALLCWACCRRGRSRVLYERSTLAPSAPLVGTPAYGTFEGPAYGRDNDAFYRPSGESAPLVYGAGNSPYGYNNGISSKN